MPIDIKDNKYQTEESIDTLQPIDIYFNHINGVFKFAAERKTMYTTDTILQTVYHATVTTILYSDNMKAWKRKMAT